MNRRFAAASASATMCSAIGSAPPPLLAATGSSGGRSRVGTQSMPAAVNCSSRALRISGISSGRNSFDVSWASTAPAAASAAARLGWRQIGEIDRLGGPAEFFRDDRAAALAQRIGHHQRPCTHSPELRCHPSAVGGRRTICSKLHATRDQCIVARVRRFGVKVAASFVSQATAPGVRRQAGPHSVT